MRPDETRRERENCGGRGGDGDTLPGSIAMVAYSELQLASAGLASMAIDQHSASIHHSSTTTIHRQASYEDQQSPAPAPAVLTYLPTYLTIHHLSISHLSHLYRAVCRSAQASLLFSSLLFSSPPLFSSILLFPSILFSFLLLYPTHLLTYSTPDDRRSTQPRACCCCCCCCVTRAHQRSKDPSLL